MSKSQLQEKSPWLNAFRDPVIKLDALEKSIILSDIMGDGDTRLLIADNQRRIICYKGVNIDWETMLNDIPIATQVFYTPDDSLPTLAIASDSFIYLYRGLKAIFKFTVPTVAMEQSEKRIWEDYNLDPNLFKTDFIEKMETLNKNQDIILSYTTLNILSQKKIKDQFNLVKLHKEKNKLDMSDTCVCMSSIKTSQDGPTTPGQLIIGTELKKVYILDSKGFQVSQTINLPGVPVQMIGQGTINNDYEIFVGLRENKIITIQNGQIKQKFTIDISSKLLSFVKVEQFLYVGLMDDSIVSYNLNGVKNFTLKMNDSICALENMEYSRSKFNGYLVALANKEIRIYKDKLLVYIFKSEGVISALKFGNFGREEGTLILVYKNKGLDVKMLIRQFNFQLYVNQAQQKQNDSLEQEVQPLNLPKKTKLFLENSAREIENPVPIHKTFQKDLMKLRLQTAQTYLSILKEGNVQNMLSNESNLRMQVSINGFGPLFRIQFNIENLSSDPMTELFVSYSYDQNIFKLIKPVYQIPFLLPNISYPIQIQVENIDPNGSADNIKILVYNKRKSQPLIGSIVPMPTSEIRDD